MTQEEAYQLIKLYRRMLAETEVGCLKPSPDEGMLILDLPLVTREFDEENDRKAAMIIAAHTLPLVV